MSDLNSSALARQTAVELGEAIDTAADPSIRVIDLRHDQNIPVRRNYRVRQRLLMLRDLRDGSFMRAHPARYRRATGQTVNHDDHRKQRELVVCTMVIEPSIVRLPDGTNAYQAPPSPRYEDITVLPSHIDCPDPQDRDAVDELIASAELFASGAHDPQAGPSFGLESADVQPHPSSPDVGNSARRKSALPADLTQGVHSLPRYVDPTDAGNEVDEPDLGLEAAEPATAKPSKPRRSNARRKDGE